MFLVWKFFRIFEKNFLSHGFSVMKTNRNTSAAGGSGAPCRLRRKEVKPNLPQKSGSSFMDGIEDLPNNLPFTTYNLHRLWALAHAKYSVYSVVKNFTHKGENPC